MLTPVINELVHQVNKGEYDAPYSMIEYNGKEWKLYHNLIKLGTLPQVGRMIRFYTNQLNTRIFDQIIRDSKQC